MLFGEPSEHNAAFADRMDRQPRRSLQQEFHENEMGIWSQEYEYVVDLPAVQERVPAPPWHSWARPCGEAAEAAEERVDAVQGGEESTAIRDEGHSGWKLEDFYLSPPARAAQLTAPEVAALRSAALYPSIYMHVITVAALRRQRISPWRADFCATHVDPRAPQHAAPPPAFRTSLTQIAIHTRA